MDKSKKIKIFIGLFYFIFVGIFLYFIFSKFSLQEITSYEFIKNNRDLFFNLKTSNLFLSSILFILFVIIWVLAGGFGSPIALLGGFIFGKWLGLFLVVLGLSTGATCLYFFANFYLKDFIKEKFSNKFSNLGEKFKRSEFLYLTIYRFIGGIPFAIQNIIPCIFNVRLLNYFFACLLGLTPQLFLGTSIGSGIEKIIDQNIEAPGIIELITQPDIYIPLIIIFCLLFITIYLRKFFYKKF
jgi:uncharacterized membrane protein YdjX (TVP38/TMEM64 family)